jgi:two-component system OmpR family sensor kinase
MRNSLQFRLSLWMAVLLLATAVAAGAVSFFWALHEANELQDDLLEQTAALVLAGQLAINPVEPLAAPGAPQPRVVVELVDAAAGEPRVNGIGRLPRDLPDGLDTHIAEGRPWRMLLAHLPDGRRFIVAQQTDRRDDIAQDSALAALVPLLVLLPVLLLLIRVVIGSTLRPIARASHQLDRQGDAALVDVPAGDMPDEVRPFVTSINALLRRLTESLEQQRRFVADAAHELRSPITALTVQAENLEHAEMSPEARRRFVPLREGLSRSRALLEQLLSLARVQAPRADTRQGQDAAAQPSVALHEVVREVVSDLVAMAEAGQVDLGVTRLDAVRVAGTPVDLQTLVRNAVDNAVRYTPAGGRVDVSLEQAGGRALLRVDDTGPGIPPDQRERVFDAFYRLLGTQQTGSGLGLSIARSIAQRLGGQIVLETAPGGGLRFEYRQESSPR